MIKKLNIKIKWDSADEIFVVTVKELKGCATHGKTISSALKHAREAITLYLECRDEISKTKKKN